MADTPIIGHALCPSCTVVRPIVVISRRLIAGVTWCNFPACLYCGAPVPYPSGQLEVSKPLPSPDAIYGVESTEYLHQMRARRSGETP